MVAGVEQLVTGVGGLERGAVDAGQISLYCVNPQDQSLVAGTSASTVYCAGASVCGALKGGSRSASLLLF